LWVKISLNAIEKYATTMRAAWNFEHAKFLGLMAMILRKIVAEILRR
jgi:hypothetical protein